MKTYKIVTYKWKELRKHKAQISEILSLKFSKSLNIKCNPQLSSGNQNSILHDAFAVNTLQLTKIKHGGDTVHSRGGKCIPSKKKVLKKVEPPSVTKIMN